MIVLRGRQGVKSECTVCLTSHSSMRNILVYKSEINYRHGVTYTSYLLPSSVARWRCLSVSGSQTGSRRRWHMRRGTRCVTWPRHASRAVISLRLTSSTRSLSAHAPCARSVYLLDRTASFRRVPDRRLGSSRWRIDDEPFHPCGPGAADSKPFCGRAIYWGP